MHNSNDIKIEIVTVTPDYAKALLGANTSNRKVSKANLDKVKTALVNGEWKVNGEAIKIAKDGRVLDGQHRLHAGSETGISFTTVVMSGLDPNTQDTMDSGKSRTPADALSLRGYKNATNVASIATAIIRTEKWGIKIGLVPGSGYAVTTAQVVARVENEPSLIDLATIGSHATRSGLTARTAGLLYYTFSKIDTGDADDFFGRLSSGEGLERGNPILTLRNSLIGIKSERGVRDQAYIGALAIKAWNKYRTGAESYTLRFVPGGANPEKFPEPK